MSGSKKVAYGICLLSIISPFQVSFSKSYLFESSPYQPTFEFSLKGGNQRTLGRVGAVMPLRGSENGLWFTQLWGLWNNDAAKEWNVSLGYRHRLANWIIGGYGFFDSRLSALNNYHSQLTVGTELLGEYLETRINGYIPTTSAKAIGTSAVDKANRVSLILANLLEKPLGGMDVEVGGTLTPCKTLQGFLTYYHFNGSDVKAIDGVRIKAQLQLAAYVALTGEASYDRLRKDSWFAGMQLSFRLGAPEKRIGLSQKMTQMVIRDVDVMTDCYVQRKKREHKYGLSICTTQKPPKPLIDKNSAFLEIKQFSAPSMVRDKIQSIIVFSARDIRLKPTILHDLNVLKPQLMTILPHDIQGMPSCQRLEDLSAFIEHSYWHIHLLGNGYGVKVHTRGLGGGDSEPEVTSHDSSRSDKEQSGSASSSNQPQVRSGQEAQHGTNIAYAAGENALALNNSENIRIKQNCTIIKFSNPLFKPKALGVRPDRNPQFITRLSATGEDGLVELKQRFDEPCNPAIVAITGMGGLGKTQLAVEYIEQNKGIYDGIFWVQANQQDYQAYIQALDIDLKEVSSEALVEVIHTKLMGKDYNRILWVYERVLWIYDDVPNATVFNETLFNDTIKSIWRQAHTKVDVLITSRYQSDWRQWIPIELTLFTLENTQAYVESFFTHNRIPFPKPNSKEIEQFNKLLGGLPLAIAQAIHYLNHQKNGMDMAQYIQAYERSFNERSWLNYSLQILNGHEQTVWTIWDITRESLSKDADLLLQMCCFLSHESIAKLLFKPLWEDKVHSIAKELADYSLITLHQDFESFNIHILLQQVLKLKQDKSSMAFNQAYNLLKEAMELFSVEDEHTWSTARGWLAHVTSILVWMNDELSKAKDFYNCGRVTYFFGDSIRAKNHWETALVLQKTYYGEDHIELANTFVYLGNVESDLGHYEEAKAYYSQALALQKTHYSEDHIEVADTFLCLGNIESELGHYEIAKNYYMQVLALKQKHYGEEHIALADALHNLGIIESNLGYYEEATDYYIQALVLYRFHYGENHIETASSLLSLGGIEYRSGHYEAAKGYYNQALALKQKHYGENHIKIAATLVGLGNVESHLGYYKEAKKYYSQALTLKQEYYGENHTETAEALHSLGDIESELGKYNSAKRYYKQALVIFSKHYGEGHIATVNTLHNLGALESDLGHYDIAKDYLEKVRAIQTEHYGEDHIEIAATLLNLGGIISTLGYYDLAKDYLNKALTLQSKHYEEDHPAIAATLVHLSNIEFDLGHYEVAKDYLEHAQAIKSARYKQDHIQMADVFIGLGAAYQKLGNSKVAKNHAMQALDLQDKHYGDGHVQLCDTYNLLGHIYLAKQRVEEACSYYQTALKINEAYYKTEHIQLTDSLVGLGNVCLAQNNATQALIYYKRALTIQETHYAGNHIKMLDTLKGLVKAYKRLNNSDKIEQYQQQIDVIVKG